MRDIVLSSFKQSNTWQQVRENIEIRKNQYYPVSMAMLKLIKTIPEKGHLQYNRKENIHLKPLIDAVSKAILETDLDFKKSYQKYNLELLQHQKILEQIYKNNNTRVSQQTLEFTKNRLQDLNSRLGNYVLQVAKELKLNYSPGSKNLSIPVEKVNIEQKFFEMFEKSDSEEININKTFKSTKSSLAIIKSTFNSKISERYYKKIKNYKYTKLLNQIDKSLNDHKYESLAIFKEIQKQTFNDLSITRKIVD